MDKKYVIALLCGAFTSSYVAHRRVMKPIKQDLRMAQDMIDVVQTESTEMGEAALYMIDLLLKAGVELTEFDKMALGVLERFDPKVF